MKACSFCRWVIVTKGVPMTWRCTVCNKEVTEKLDDYESLQEAS